MLRVKKLIKLTGIVLGILIALLILVAVIVPRVVDPNDYKGRIVALVREKTGRQLRIEGDIALSMFPWLGVKLGTVELGNAQGFEAPLFARIEELRIRVRLLPLLSKRLEADVVSVRGLSLNLERNEDGRTNWGDLARVEPEEETDKGAERETIIGALAIGGVNVREASVTWTDRVSEHRVSVTDLSLDTSKVTLVDPVDVRLSFGLDSGNIGLNGRIESNARIKIDLKNKIYTVENMEVKADLKGKMIPGGAASIKGSGAVTFETEPQRFQLDQWKLEAGGISLPPHIAVGAIEMSGTGDLAAQAFNLPDFKAALTVTGDQDRISSKLQGNIHADLRTKKMTVSGLSLEIPESNFRGTHVQVSSPTPASVNVDLGSMTFLIDSLKFATKVSGDSIPDGSVMVDLSSRVQGNLNQQTLSIDPLKLEVLGAKASGNLMATKLQTSPEVSGAFSISKFNLRELLGRVVKRLPEMRDPKAFSSAALSVTFALSPDTAKLENIVAIFDDSRLTGSAAMSNFRSPDLSFDLAIDRLLLDRYLTPKQTGKTVGSTAAATASGVAARAVLPVETLRKLSLNGKLHISELMANNVKITDLLLGIRAKDGLIRTDPINAFLYDGSYTAAVALDVHSPEPKIDFDEKLTGLNLGRLLKDLGINVSALELSGPTSMHLKGSVATDIGFKVVNVERLTVEGNLGGKLPFQLDGGGSRLNLNDQTLKADGLKVAIGDMNLQVKTLVTSFLDKPEFSLDLNAPRFNLRQVLSKIGQKSLEISDPKALTAVEIAVSAKGSAEGFSANALKVRLDEALLEGSVRVTLKPSAAYQFNIQVDDIDLDRYLPPAKEGPKSGPAGGAKAKSTPPTALPLDMLRELNLEGKLAIGKAKMANVRLQRVDLQARGKDGLVTINPLKAILYGGTSSGSLSIDTRGKEAQLRLDEMLVGVQAGPLLNDLKGRAMLTGLTNLDMKVSASGADTKAITQTLDGNVTFQLTDGSIEKLDIAGKICKVLSAYSAGSLNKEAIAAGLLQMATTKQAKAGEQASDDRTKFSEMHGSMVFAKGVGTNRDLMLKSPLLRVEGAGKLDLPNERLDYQATAVLVKSCEGQGGKSSKELTNYPIPVSISGPLDSLDVKPNLTSGIIQILQRRQTREQPTPAPQPQPSERVTPPSQQQTEEPRDSKKQVEDAVKDVLQRGLQDLFKKK
jgi:AsmA protein